MSARLDLSCAVPEIMDAVIYMDNSPAYSAFKEEIEAILANFNENKTISHHWVVDPSDLTEKSADTLANMHRAFLFWSFKEGKEAEGNKVHSLIKLFLKSQESTLRSLVPADGFVDAEKIPDVKAAFIGRINSDTEVFESVKAFFKGYVYGCYFNYLEEAVIMKDYAKMLAFMGVMSGAVETTVSERQKVLIKMAPLLQNERFRYLNGLVPFELITDMIYDRVAFGSLPDVDVFAIKSAIADFMRTNYATDSEDGAELISDSVPTDLLERFFSYTSTVLFTDDIYRNSFSGVRPFTDSDRDDTGDYSAEKLNSVAGECIAPLADPYYDMTRASILDTSLGSGFEGYRFPVFIANGKEFFFAGIYRRSLCSFIENAVFDDCEVPTGFFPFVDEALETNVLRTYLNVERTGVSVRHDRIAVAEQAKRLAASDIPDGIKRMLLLEQYLCLISASMSEAKYKAVFTEHFLGTDLYEEYIRYRMNVLVTQALKGLEGKKNLLDRINEIG